MSKSAHTEHPAIVWVLTIIGTIAGLIAGYVAGESSVMAPVLAAGLGFIGYYIGTRVSNR